ncbi:MAG TPA: TRAP transporter small permease [Succinivibrionaceae bacterium]|nr:TRAP transporter small permease [Succinivibrionaceae bacterium]
MKKLLKLLDDKLEISICVTLMCILSVVLAIQVFFRYVMGASLSWSEEMSRYMFVWLVYIGIAYGCKIMRHIKIDAGLFLFPKAMRKYVVILGDCIFFCFALAIVYYAWGLVVRQYVFGQLSPAMQIPMWIVYAAPFVGFLLTAVRQLQTIIFRIQHLHDPDPEPTEVDLKKL